MNAPKLPDPAAPASLPGVSAAARAALERIAPEALAELELGTSPKIEDVTSPRARSEANRFAREHAPSNPQGQGSGARQRSPGWRKRNRYVAQLERANEHRKRWQRKQDRRLAELGLTRAELAREAQRYGWSLSTWQFVRRCQHDPTGTGIRAELQAIRRRAPAFAGAVVRAALEPQGDERARRSWTAQRAQNVALLLLAMWKDSIPTRRKGLYRRLFRGVTVGSMLALLERPKAGRRLHRNTLIGRHKPGASLAGGGGQLGYLLAGEQAGAFYAQQLPPAAVTPAERWIVYRRNAAGELEPREYSSNRYWLACAHPADAYLSDGARARAGELAGDAAALERETMVVVTRRELERALELELAALIKKPPD